MPALNLADNVMLGDQQVDKIMLGTTQIWPSAGGPAAWWESLPSLHTVYDFSIADSVTIGTGISQISDLTGNGHDASQATAGSQPAWGTRTQNGLYVADFDGNDFLAASWAALPQPFTVIAVAKWDDISGFPFLFDGASGSDRAFFIAHSEGWYMGAPSGGGIGSRDTNLHLFTLRYNGASSKFRIDGVQSTNSAVATGDWVGAKLGSQQDGGNALDGLCGTFVVCGALLDDATCAEAEAGANAQWAVF